MIEDGYWQLSDDSQDHEDVETKIVAKRSVSGAEREYDTRNLVIIDEVNRHSHQSIGLLGEINEGPAPLGDEDLVPVDSTSQAKVPDRSPSNETASGGRDHP